MTHTHSLGSDITGHVLHNGELKEFARRDPQMPQTFQEMQRFQPLKEGDVIQARCYFDGTRANTSTHIGMFQEVNCLMFVVMIVSLKPTGYRTSDAMCKLFVMYFFDEETTNPCNFLNMCAPVQDHGQISTNRHASSIRRNDRAKEHPRYKRYNGRSLLRHSSSVSLRSGTCHGLFAENRYA